MINVDHMPHKRDGSYIQPEKIRSAGFQDAHGVLIGVDELLAAYGLELMLSNGSGDFEFQIVRRKTKSDKPVKRPRYRGPVEVEPGA